MKEALLKSMKSIFKKQNKKQKQKNILKPQIWPPAQTFLFCNARSQIHYLKETYHGHESDLNPK